MGVRGLTTYIDTKCSPGESYELHGGYIVIDGNSLAVQLYLHSNCNCIFGGDYDVYAHTVEKFFADLVKCEVEPLVVLDGGMEHKKLKTSYERMSSKLHTAFNYTPETTSKFVPMTIIMVFETVLRQKDVKFVRCIFEADPAIAGIARVFDCPVLSFDSDFYIFEGMYISLETLECEVSRSTNGKGYMKRCKLFKTEHLLKLHPGLDSSVLPLAAVLVGNDFVNSTIFQNLFKYSRGSTAGQNKKFGACKIYQILEWLRNYELDDAVAAILSTIPIEHRRTVLVIIEVIINRYLVLPIDILAPLGFSEKYSIELERRRSPFKFEGDIDTLDPRQFWPDAQVHTNVNSRSYNQTWRYMNFDLDHKKDVSTAGFAKSWPSWFVECYNVGKFPPYFINMMYLGLCMIPTQIEDFRYPSAYTVSLDIVEVIYGLLMAGYKKPVPRLSYLVRDQRLNFVTIDQNGPPLRGTISTKFPPLAKLRKTPTKIRKQIIDDTLMIAGAKILFQDIPDKWKLYMATIFYWMVVDKVPKNNKLPIFENTPGQTDNLPKNSCHLDAVLFAMLLGVVDKKIGYQRSLEDFNKAHKETLDKIQSDRKNSNYVNSEIGGNSINEALEAVTKEDCLFAAPFIIRNCTMNELIVTHPETFNVTIVHAFAQFQSCLKHAIDLNVLLGCPYESPIIAETYNGTMLYNLYTNLKKNEDVASYISVNLENSPSLRNLMRLLIARMMTILDKITIDDKN